MSAIAACVAPSTKPQLSAVVAISATRAAQHGRKAQFNIDPTHHQRRPAKSNGTTLPTQARNLKGVPGRLKPLQKPPERKSCALEHSGHTPRQIRQKWLGGLEYEGRRSGKTGKQGSCGIENRPPAAFSTDRAVEHGLAEGRRPEHADEAAAEIGRAHV